ncbi:Iron-containing alcohol dehydrogenase [compost metagenome]
MPYVLEANRTAIERPLSHLGRYLGLARCDAQGVLEWILRLREEIGIPHSLAEIGLDDSQAERIAQMAELDPSAATNPIAFSREEYRQLFERALRGSL